MPDKPYEDVQIEGHLIDSLMMPHIMDQIMDLDGEFEMLTFEVGRMKDDPSHAVMRIFGRDAAHLDELLQAITEFGVVAVRPQDAVLEVADSGVGIPPEDLPHVFTRFWRGEKSRSRATGGAGIGLTIVRELVRAHGGRITVESTVGQGSAFRVVIPCCGDVPPH